MTGSLLSREPTGPTLRFSFGAPIDFDAPLCSRFTHRRAQVLRRHRMKSGRFPPARSRSGGGREPG